MRSSKFTRQLRMHELAMSKLRSGDADLADERLAGYLELTARNVGGLHQLYVARWRELLRSGDVELVDSIVGAESDEAAEMRNLSPLPLLLSDEERRDAVAMSIYGQ